MYISQYKVDDTPLGEGGMGRIYKARSPEGHVVAIKEILPEYAADIEMRFRINQERCILDRLDNPSIVKTYESFMLDDKFYIVMELVEGMNLEQYVVGNGPFSEAEAADVMSRVLEVMQYVHDEKVVHRDLKPSNIMLRPDGTICLLDFGIAKDMQQTSTAHLAPGAIIGSDGYMSPEQAMGMAIDHRSDIYALGCVLFYMLTGRHAFPIQESESLMLDAMINKPFPELAKYVKGTSKEMQSVLEKATDKNMTKRYQHCVDFENALREVIGEEPIISRLGSTVNIKQGVSCCISVGRYNPYNPGACDIEINDPTTRVSGHHADIELKSFTGGTFFIYHDRSTNGTKINGNDVHNMAFHIGIEDPDPVIWLADDPRYELDWQDIKRRLIEKANNQPINSEGSTIIFGHEKGDFHEESSIDSARGVSSRRLIYILLGLSLALLGLGGIVLAFLLTREVTVQAAIAAFGAIIIGFGVMFCFKKE